MNPLFFGSSSEKLFGVFHPAVGGITPTEGTVICYPLAHEYTAAHRAMRQLAIELARAGRPVLRFDYYGTGDSMGEEDEMDLQRAEQDLELAIQELKDLAEVGRVSLVGLRLGASLAASVGSGRRDVSKVVTWDPVVTGTVFLEELRANRRRVVETSGPLPADVLDGGLSTQLIAQLQNLNLEEWCQPPPDKMFLMTSTSLENYRAFADRCEIQGAQVLARCVPSRPVWQAGSPVSNELVPKETIEAITSWLRN